MRQKLRPGDTTDWPLRPRWRFLQLLLVALLAACAGQSTAPEAPDEGSPAATSVGSEPTASPAKAEDSRLGVSEVEMSTHADVLSAMTTGGPGAYHFSVEVASPDTGCDQYADWWEVLSEDGELLYRRTLLHSHVGEQPFARSGGPVAIEPGRALLIRAHMHPTGYGGRGLRGSVDRGFEIWEATGEFAAELESMPPQPPDCAF